MLPKRDLISVAPFCCFSTKGNDKYKHPLHKIPSQQQQQQQQQQQHNCYEAQQMRDENITIKSILNYSFSSLNDAQNKFTDLQN